MKIAVLGSGSIGLLTGTCLAALGHDTWCMELNTDTNGKGNTFSWEPGVNELLLRAINEGRIHFTTDHSGALQGADVTFIATESAVNVNGNPATSALWKAVALLANQHEPSPWTVILGEVPFGTTQSVQEHLGANTKVAHQVEFLSPGTSIRDFLQPERLVIGTDALESRHTLAQLYRHIPVSVEWMKPGESEWTQFAHKAMWAMKRSYTQQLNRLHQRKDLPLPMNG